MLKKKEESSNNATPNTPNVQEETTKYEIDSSYNQVNTINIKNPRNSEEMVYPIIINGGLATVNGTQFGGSEYKIFLSSSMSIIKDLTFDRDNLPKLEETNGLKNDDNKDFYISFAEWNNATPPTEGYLYIAFVTKAEQEKYLNDNKNINPSKQQYLPNTVTEKLNKLDALKKYKWTAKK